MTKALSKGCLYFGTFNPIHTGHLMIAQAVLNQFAKRLGFNHVLWIPAGNPPHRSQDNDLAEAQHRFNMVERAVASNPAFWVSDYEVKKQTPSYTVETVEALMEASGLKPPIPMIIGSDALKHLSTWHRPERLVELVCFLQMPRPGARPVSSVVLDSQTLDLMPHLIEMPMLSLSSSWIRAQIQQAQGNCQGLRYWLPEPVREYIQDNALYK